MKLFREFGFFIAATVATGVSLYVVLRLISAGAVFLERALQ